MSEDAAAKPALPPKPLGEIARQGRWNAIFFVTGAFLLWVLGYAGLRFAFEGVASFAGYEWAETRRTHQARLELDVAELDATLAVPLVPERTKEDVSLLVARREHAAAELEEVRASKPLPAPVATIRRIVIIGLTPLVMLVGSVWAVVEELKKRRRTAEAKRKEADPEEQKKRMDLLLERWNALNPGKVPPGVEKQLAEKAPPMETKAPDPKPPPVPYSCIRVVSDDWDGKPRPKGLLGRGARPQEWPGGDDDEAEEVGEDRVDSLDFADDEDIDELGRNDRALPLPRTPSRRTLRINVAEFGGWSKLLYRLGDSRRLHHAKRIDLTCLQTAVDACVLMGLGDDLRRYSGTLVIEATAEALDAVDLRLMFEGFRFVPRPPDLPYRTRPRASAVPTKAPRNFRDLAPCTKTDKGVGVSGRIESEYVGSGIPFADHPIMQSAFHRCMDCASNDTRCIYAKYSKIFGREESSVESIVEYQCFECGKLTFYETHEYR